MPGYSSECESGAHGQCAERPGECRCICHAHTQALIKKGPAKASGRGGIRRKGGARDAEIVIPKPGMQFVPEPEVPVEIHNTCPKCGTRAKATDSFCRKDGTKLCLGKPCVRCEAPCEEADVHCWQCGWKLSDQPPPPDLSPSLTLPPSNGQEPGSIAVESSPSNPAATTEDPIVRLQRIAREQGLLPRETTVS